jgi:hypothetical protein
LPIFKLVFSFGLPVILSYQPSKSVEIFKSYRGNRQTDRQTDTIIL